MHETKYKQYIGAEFHDRKTINRRSSVRDFRKGRHEVLHAKIIYTCEKEFFSKRISLTKSYIYSNHFMKRLPISLLLILYTGLMHAQTFIIHANVIDVINMKIVADETVVISNGKIINVDKSDNIKIPQHANVIDGSGKYLLPGMTDAHVHFFQSGSLYARPDVIDMRKYRPYDKEIEWTHAHMEDFLHRYLAAGITTVIDPGSAISFLIQRDTFKTRFDVPSIYMTGPLLTTYEPAVYKGLNQEEPFYFMKTEGEARKYVDSELPYKPDFIKIWFIVSGNADSVAVKSSNLVKAVIDEAHKNRLKVAVHATELATARIAVENGADYLVHSVDDKIIDDGFIQLLKQHHVIVCPTLQVLDNYIKTFAQQYVPSVSDKAFSNPDALNSLNDLAKIPDTALAVFYKKRGEVLLKTMSPSKDSIMEVNLKKLSDAGITIAAGTDAGNIGTQHAGSFFTELKRMNAAGMSIAQVLQAATINGAKILGKENEFGSIEKGKLADMVLLTDNPLENLDNLQKTVIVIKKGKVITPASLIKNQ
jgi:imidazolonepropionase-like amidohydrolase